MKARDLIKNGETAVVIFTDGRHLQINNDGFGQSGNWRINNNLSVNKIIVYRRDREKRTNDVYLGDFVELTPSVEKGLEHRWAIKFSNLKLVGNSDQNWNEFTETKRGSVTPVKYIR